MSIKDLHGVCGGDIETWNYVLKQLSCNSPHDLNGRRIRPKSKRIKRNHKLTQHRLNLDAGRMI